jgi:hypothetical protein
MKRFESPEYARLIAEKVSVLAKKSGKASAFIFGNTKKRLDEGRFIYYPPIKDLTYVVAGHAIVYSQKDASAMAEMVDGIVDIIFVDAEKKAMKYPGHDLGNIASGVIETVKKSKVFTFKANDLTVSAVDTLISQLKEPLAGKRVAIIGVGNTGFKLALKLVERGCRVTITRRNRELLAKIAEVINSIKPEETISCVNYTYSNLDASVDADILIGATHGTPAVTVDMIKVMKPEGIIIDMGKGCIYPEAITFARSRGMKVFRVDSLSGFEGAVSTILETEKIIRGGMGRRKLNGIWMVSGGIMGERGDIVVDNINDPKVIAGIANGYGDFIINPSQEELDRLRRLEKILNSRA